MRIYSACLFVFVYIIANVYVMLAAIRSPEQKKLTDSLDKNQTEIYRRIKSERMKIYIWGALIGIVFGLFILQFGEKYIGCE